ncbi:terminase large subunit domain-containing protein [Agarivorans gilvus]|uniref:Mu-like prophage FluMu protein gp28 n=1 Tax=Agarivorans gilvus TaxID=680279 RepID=A0ABQ1HYY1_9ALTE|nr:terminase family protein [Agarivorans gilvus]GGA95846.1 hypothetical protein GCM10007414_05860 [Agarivorans gilvus]
MKLSPAAEQVINTFQPNEVLLQYQKDWIADEATVKLAEKSRRTGLTWAEAADAVLCAGAQKSAGGCNHFYVGSNKEMAREFIDACAMWAKAFDKAASTIQEEVLRDEDRDILTFAIYFESGFKIQALSSNPSNLRGMQGNVTIDEAAFHDRLAEVLKAALALTMWGSKVRLISTHNGIDHLFNQLIEDARAGRKNYSIHRITLDDACSQGLYQRICQIKGTAWSQAAEDQWKQELLQGTATEEDALEEYYCVPKSGGGAYLSRSLIESRQQPCPVIQLQQKASFNEWPEHLRRAEINDWCQEVLLPLLEQLNPAKRHVFGEDFARSGDFTVISVGQLNDDMSTDTVLQIELRNMPFKQQEQILFYIVDRLPRLSGGALDARGNGQYLAEAAADRYGSGVIEQVMLSGKFYLENMPRFKAALEDGLLNVPQHRDTLDDLRALQINRQGIPCLPQGKTGENKERHGDAAIALFLMHYASTIDGAMIEFTPLPSKAERAKDDDFAHYERGCW